MFSETIIISAHVLAPASIVSLVKPQHVCRPTQIHVSQADRHATLRFTAKCFDNAVAGKPCVEPHLQEGPERTFPSTTAQEVQSEVPSSAPLLAQQQSEASFPHQ